MKNYEEDIINDIEDTLKEEFGDEADEKIESATAILLERYRNLPLKYKWAIRVGILIGILIGGYFGMDMVGVSL